MLLLFLNTPRYMYSHTPCCGPPGVVGVAARDCHLEIGESKKGKRYFIAPRSTFLQTCLWNSEFMNGRGNQRKTRPST